MEASDRRTWMKSAIAGMSMLALPRLATAEDEDEKHPRSHAGTDEFWKQLEEIHARDLAGSAVQAARAEVQHQRSLTAAKRASVLLGGDAGREHMFRAQMEYDTRTGYLRRTKQALAQFVKNTDEARSRQFASFVQQGGIRDTTAHARQLAIWMMLNSDLSPEQAQAGLKAMDANLGRVQGLKSLQEVTAYLDHHLDELIGRKMGEVDPNGLCVLILILTSIFLALVLIAVLICAFTFGLGCQGILDQLIANACP